MARFLVRLMTCGSVLRIVVCVWLAGLAGCGDFVGILLLLADFLSCWALPAAGERPLRGMPGSVKCLVGAVDFLRCGGDGCACVVGGMLAGSAAVTCRPRTGRSFLVAAGSVAAGGLE